MCTIGAVKFSESNYCLFKNKDFASADLPDQLVLTPDIFGVRGVENFDTAANQKGIFSGFSIGANKFGLLCADTNVKVTGDNGRNYDLLVELALRQGRDVPTALAAIKNSLQKQPSWWGNLILTDDRIFAAVEVRGTHMRVEYGQDRIVCTNHQPSFGETTAHVAASTSVLRLEAAQRRIGMATAVSDILALQKAHDDGETGICNHTSLQTVYSYLLQQIDGELQLYVTRGAPCEHGAHHLLTIPLGTAWSPDTVAQFTASYP